MLTRQIFYVHLTVLQTFSEINLISVCELSIIWRKRIYWQHSYKFWEKKIFFQKPKVCTFWEILIRTLRMKNFQTLKRTLASTWTLSIGKTEKETFNFRFERMIALPYSIMGGKTNECRRVQNRDGQHLNGNHTMPKTERHSENTVVYQDSHKKR